ncbi:hypothetical protein QE357_002604 [Siphonobacter sp. BAB-5404]|nr:hypothetical protein [Siphonobacter sp. SORGH_AS_0500]
MKRETNDASEKAGIGWAEVVGVASPPVIQSEAKDPT